MLIKINSQSKILDLHFYLSKTPTNFSGSTIQVKSSGSSPHFEEDVVSFVIVCPELGFSPCHWVFENAFFSPAVLCKGVA